MNATTQHTPARSESTAVLKCRKTYLLRGYSLNNEETWEPVYVSRRTLVGNETWYIVSFNRYPGNGTITVHPSNLREVEVLS